jgi:hypothetical protein
MSFIKTVPETRQPATSRRCTTVSATAPATSSATRGSSTPLYVSGGRLVGNVDLV